MSSALADVSEAELVVVDVVVVSEETGGQVRATWKRLFTWSAREYAGKEEVQRK